MTITPPDRSSASTSDRPSLPGQPVELTFEGGRDFDNPYLELDVDVDLVDPAGGRIRRPAYWDGGRKWRVRFANTCSGTWRYAISCPGDPDLDGSGGEVFVLEAESSGSVDRGFIEPSADGTHLRYRGGAPFLWLGDTHWRFLAERWDDANKEGWRSQFRGTVDRRVQQGFTVYQTNLMSFSPGWATSPIWSSGASFERLDVDYLGSVVDPRMAYIAGSGLVNAIGLAWYDAVDAGSVGVARFARYAAARWGAVPVVWILGGEVPGYDPAKRPERLERWREVALALSDADAYRHPLTAHLPTERPIATYYQGEPWLTLTLHQHGHGDLDLSPAYYRRHIEGFPGVPIVEGESLYEGLTSVESAGRRVVTDTMVRQAAYRAFLSGCCGYSYGAQGCWNGAWDVNDVATEWGDLPWSAGVDLPGAIQLGHLRQLLESVGWERLRPDDGIFVTTNVFNAQLYSPQVSADRERSTVLAYFGETYRSGGGLASLVGLGPHPYSLRWFDPRSGHRHLISLAAQPADGRLDLPDKPDLSDWLLLAQETDLAGQ